MTIDTHQHFWKLERGDYAWLTPALTKLYRDFQPDDLKPLMDAAGITGTIAVQAADTEAETEYLLSLADRHDWIGGVVGWVDLEAESAPASVAQLAQHPKLVGLRPMIQDIGDDAWMLRPALAPAIAEMVRNNLTFDALVMPRHLRHLLEFLRTYPDLCVVVDHCAKPEIRDKVIEGWAADMAEIATYPQVFCKISGLVTEAAENWGEEDLKPYVQYILGSFARDRLLFGSDWPVVNLASDYGAWKELAQSYLGGNIPNNAASAYPRLGPPPK
ncbi:amidohydrolase [Ruegeria sp. AU67]|uniref:amidohydrolase family protein n=1 Tax=Ruegeria sp. AU67 TaxID=2108530 RepID=UPI000D695EDF|nr:amidohydrolase family protein [Ruegeria sp. AU67]